MLDEPNAALDNIAENKLAKLYKGLFNNNIGIVIVHRFKNLLDNVDRVIVIKDGTIERDGPVAYVKKNSIEFNRLFTESIYYKKATEE